MIIYGTFWVPDLFLLNLFLHAHWTKTCQKTVSWVTCMNSKRIPPYLRMHSATTSYCPIEQAVWRSSGTFSSSGPIRASPPSASHTDRLAPNWSDSLLASSLSSDIILCKWGLICTVYVCMYSLYVIIYLISLQIFCSLFSEIIFRYLVSDI